MEPPVREEPLQEHPYYEKARLESALACGSARQLGVGPKAAQDSPREAPLTLMPHPLAASATVTTLRVCARRAGPARRLAQGGCVSLLRGCVSPLRGRACRQVGSLAHAHAIR